MKVYQNKNLSSYHTFGMDVSADEFIVMEYTHDILDFIRLNNDLHKERVLILGSGSNVLFLEDFRGRVIQINTKGIELLKETDGEVLIRVAAGETWDDLVDYCVSHGWGGLENLSGIPGNTGSSPIQNIGAYGSELKDQFYSVNCIDIITGRQLELNREQCQFGYRDSIFKRELKGKVIITEVVLKLTVDSKPNLSYQALVQYFKGVPLEEISLHDVRQAVLQIRSSKLPDPKVIGNAGSFFKNPVVNIEALLALREKFPGIVFYETQPSAGIIPPGDMPQTSLFKLAAGWLIEQCGWKGYREKDAGVHKEQALVLVNYGHATGAEIHGLSEKIRESVKSRFGIELEREVNVISNSNPVS